MSPDLIQLKRFVVTARKGTFTAAAREMYVTSQTVSQSVRDLERMLHVPLLYQRAKTLHTTPFGDEVLCLAEVALDSVDDICRRAAERQVACLSSGSVRLAVASSPLRGSVFHQQDFQHFGCEHPGISLLVEYVPPETCLAGLREGMIDAAIVTGEACIEAVDSLHLGGQPLCALVARSHRLASRQSISLGDLHGERLAVSYDFTGCRGLLRRCFSASGVKPVPTSLEMDLLSHRRFLDDRGVVLVIPDPCLAKLYPQAVAVPFADGEEISLPYRFVAPARCANPAVPLVRAYVRNLAHRLRKA